MYMPGFVGHASGHQSRSKSLKEVKEEGKCSNFYGWSFPRLFYLTKEETELQKS